MPEAETVVPSRARKLAIAVAAAIGEYVEDRATMKTLWHPSFAGKGELESPIVNVRPASRGRTNDGKLAGNRDVMIEISIVQHLPKPSAGEDSHNQLETIDALDALAEEIMELFVRDYDDEDSTAGALAQRPLYQFIPTDGVEQAATLFNQVLESDRLFLTVITVPYRRWE